jgi:hypothetical protein
VPALGGPPLRAHVHSLAAERNRLFLDREAVEPIADAATMNRSTSPIVIWRATSTGTSRRRREVPRTRASDKRPSGAEKQIYISCGRA